MADKAPFFEPRKIVAATALVMRAGSFSARAVA
jgi:hypothetical protein